MITPFSHQKFATLKHNKHHLAPNTKPISQQSPASKNFLRSEVSMQDRNPPENADIIEQIFTASDLSLESVEPEDLASDSMIDERLASLEGECKIKQHQFLKFNLTRSVLLMILVTISVIGLFALKYSARFRRKVFYTDSTASEATHIFITSNENAHAIVKIMVPGTYPINFEYEKLKYTISTENNKKPLVFALRFEKRFHYFFNQHHMKTGLTQAEVQNSRELYGSNEHLVEIPSYIFYLIDVLTQPFFLMQYFFCFAFIFQGYAPMAAALIVFSLLTTTINYIMLYVSYKKIKKIAQKKIEVLVIRDGIECKIDSSELVPGDVYIPEQQQEIPADCIVCEGDIYVNEANLTGETHPIGKFKVKKIKQIRNSNIWVYEGSKILELRKGNTFCIVINTGFATTRGQIIRRILTREVKDPDLLRSTLIFVCEVVLVSLITFFATLFILLTRDIEPIFIFFKFIDFLASSAPPPLPIFFNLAYSLSLFRLRFKKISGTEPQKTLVGAQVKTLCFDKTGTLTINQVEVRKILKVSSSHIKNISIQSQHQASTNQLFQQISSRFNDEQNRVIWQLFSTCHATKYIQSQLLGDEIDKEMFIFCQAQFQKSDDINIKFEVANKKECTPNPALKNTKTDELLQVLRINQFESKFQSMSVLVTDTISKKHYIFVKGAPEKILSNSINIYSFQTYTRMIKQLSLQGYRTIGMGYKEILSEAQLKFYLNADRSIYDTNLINLGLIAFDNKLKEDTAETMGKLVNANIDAKMITGDNIYIAVETARRAGIIRQEDKVVFLEGRNQERDSDNPYGEGFMSNLEMKKNLDRINSLNSGQNFLNNEKKNIVKTKMNRKFVGTIMEMSKQNFDVQSTLFPLPLVQKQSKDSLLNLQVTRNMSEMLPNNIEGSEKNAESNNSETKILNFREKTIMISERDDYNDDSSHADSPYIFAVDNSFITLDPPPFLSKNIKIFARVPPESKALIIKTYKDQYLENRQQNQSKFSRFLKINKLKVGMCGDGANDLLALRQADLSIGIQQTDASYGSSFNIKNIADVYEIIKEAKCTQANIMQLFQFYITISFTIVISSILMIADATYFSLVELMYLNFGTVLLIPGAMSFSRPSSGEGENAKYVPDSNMMSLHNHLIVWGNILISFAGIMGSYFYFYRTPEYRPNPDPVVSQANNGFNSQNHTATLIFFLSILTTACNGFIMYRSKSWKQKIYRNYTLTLLLVINFTVAMVLPFFTSSPNVKKVFEFEPISIRNMGICIGIMLAVLAVNLTYNLIVEHFRLDHKILEDCNKYAQTENLFSSQQAAIQPIINNQQVLNNNEIILPPDIQEIKKQKPSFKLDK